MLAPERKGHVRTNNGTTNLMVEHMESHWVKWIEMGYILMFEPREQLGPQTCLVDNQG